MSSESTGATKPSNVSAFSRSRSKTASRHLTSKVIAADIAAFKKRGGRIEVLGNTPYRSHLASTAFRSDAQSKLAATAPVAATSAARG